MKATGRRCRGQAMVEFALVGPMVLLLLMVVLDFGRGFFFYTQMSAGAREAARQAVLQSNQYSNTTAPPLGCGGSCSTAGVVPVLSSLTAFGFPVVYSDSVSSSTAPSYGTCAGGNSTTVATCSLSAGSNTNQVYVFVYQFGPNTSNPAGGPHFACPSCAGGSGQPRTGGHDRVVVDLKMKFQPIALRLFGLPTYLVLDAQTVEREEW